MSILANSKPRLMKEDEDVAVIGAINIILRACMKDTICRNIDIREVAFNWKRRSSSAQHGGIAICLG